jgi:hypothetical protein
MILDLSTNATKSGTYIIYLCVASFMTYQNNLVRLTLGKDTSLVYYLCLKFGGRLLLRHQNTRLGRIFFSQTH